MPLKVIIILFCGLPLFLTAQNNERDILKIGYTQVYLAKQNSFVPGLFVEYNRTFYPPITIGVSGGLATTKGVIDAQDTYDLTTFNLDFNFLYGILDNDKNQFQLGLGISARSFQVEGVERATNIAIKTNSLRPGISALINYHYIFDPLVLGFRGAVQNYSEEGAVYFLGGFLGLRF